MALLINVALIVFSIFKLRFSKPSHAGLWSQLSETSKWQWRLWFMLLLNGLISLAITFHSGSGINTTGGYVFHLLARQPGTDSWDPMAMAIEHLRKHPDVSLYSDLFFKHHVKFQYPLSSLLFFDGTQRLIHHSWATVYRFFNDISLLSILATGLVTYYLFSSSLNNQQAPQFKIQHPLLMLLWIATAFFFYPLVRSYYLGQIQTLMTLLAALGLLAWQWHKKPLAGVMLGICCAIKPQWLVIVLWGCIRRQWGFAFACAGTFGVFTLAAMLLYGIHNFAEYLSVLSYISHHGESYFPNQSVNGLANRFLFNGNDLNWDEHHFAPYQPVVYDSTMLSGIIIVGIAVLWRFMAQPPSTLHLALVMLSLTMASPVAWEHHYAILLPIIAVAAPVALSHYPYGKLTGIYLWVSYILVSQQLDELAKLTAASHWNFLQSYLLFGATMIFILLIQLTTKGNGFLYPDQGKSWLSQ